MSNSRDYVAEVISLEIARVYAEIISDDYDNNSKTLCSGCLLDTVYRHDVCVQSGVAIEVRVAKTLDSLLDKVDHVRVYRMIGENLKLNRLAYIRFASTFNLVRWLKNDSEQILLGDMICTLYRKNVSDKGIEYDQLLNRTSKYRQTELIIDEEREYDDDLQLTV